MSAQVVGMLGAGQLARMMALAGAPLGLRTHIFAPLPGPATQVTDLCTLAAYDDWEALARFAEAVDVVTYEFENVPAETAAFLAARVPVHPGAEILAVCQNRIREKTFLGQRAHVLTAPWVEVREIEELAAFQEQNGGMVVLKTAQGGYDGKGQENAGPGSDLAQIVAQLRGPDASRPLIAEGWVDFAYEASVMVARTASGACKAWEPGRNTHRDHILHTTTIPAGMPDALVAQAISMAEHIATCLDYVGVLGVELFVGHDGTLRVNELAPRVHNSGHWTQDGAITSQFEQHMRAVAGLPLGSVARVGEGWRMTNLLGHDIDQVPQWLAQPGAHVHVYGKPQVRPGRKMAHINAPWCSSPG